MAVFGMRGIGDWAVPDERPKNYREQAFRLFEGSPAPFTAILSKLPSSTVDDAEFKIFEDRLPDMAYTVSGTPNSSQTYIPLQGTNPAQGIKSGQVFIVPRTSELILVDQDPSASNWGQIHVVRGFGGTSGAAMQATDVLEWAGTAYGQGTGAPTAIAKAPAVVTNYAQLFKDSCQMTGTALQTNVRPDKPWPREKKKALERHMINIEKAFILGGKGAATDPNGQPLLSTGGLITMVTTNVTDFSSTGVSMDGLETACQNVFKYGSSQKIAFCGNVALTMMNRVVRNNSQFFYQGNTPMDKKGTYGLRIFNFITPHGELGLIPHHLLNESTTYNSWVFVVDPKFAEYVCVRGRDTSYKEVGLETAMLNDFQLGQYLTEAGLRLGLQETHAIWKNLTSFAA